MNALPAAVLWFLGATSVALGQTADLERHTFSVEKMGLGAVTVPSAFIDLAADMTKMGVKGPAFSMAVHENNPNGFTAMALTSDRLKGGGGENRTVLYAQQLSEGAVVGEQIGAINGDGHIRRGSGTIFGVNAIATIDAEADSSASLIGEEIDTEAARPVVSKIGLQIIDTFNSKSHGSANDTAMIIGQNVGGIGYNVGIKFGVLESSEPSFGISPDGVLIYAEPTPRPLRALIDWSRLSGHMRDGAILLPASKNASIKFGGAAAEGGSIVSGTASNGMQLLFGDRQMTLSRRGAAGVTVSDTGVVTAAAYKATLITPASSSAPCIPGQFSDDASFHYVCVAKNKWRRVALSDF